MSSTSQDFTLFAGDDATPEIDIKDQNGNPIDISAASDIIWEVWSYPDHVFQFRKDRTTSPATILIPSPAGGVVNVVIRSRDTEGLDGIFEHFLTLVDASGNRSTVTEGLLTILSRPGAA